MALQDCYVVLGIPRTESAEGIRKAFHDLVREHHPDRAGPRGTPVFRELVEAYRVLSDPGLRRDHDRQLGERSPERLGVPASRARRGGGTRAFDDVGLLRQPEGIRPSAEALLDHILRNFAAGGLAKSAHPEPLLCDVALSRTEASRGGILPIRVPILSPCPDCHGAGSTAGFGCHTCGSAGHLRREAVVPLDVPAGMQSGRIVEMPLDRWGIGNLWLRVRIRVG